MLEIIDIRFQMLCASCGVLSLVFANGAGSYIFQLMDSFAGNYTLLIIAFCEVSASTELFNGTTKLKMNFLVLIVYCRVLCVRTEKIRR